MSDSVDRFSVGRQSLPNCQRNATIVTSVSFKFSCIIAFWSESMAAAEARKAEGDSIHALLTPNVTIWTGRDACIH